MGPGPTVDGDAYDAVVLAMPDPQALRLLDPSSPAAALLADRDWEPSLALAAGFAARSWDLDGAFVADDPVLSWVADDGSRRGDGAPVLVAHSTPAFAAAHLDGPDAAGAGDGRRALRARARPAGARLVAGPAVDVRQAGGHPRGGVRAGGRGSGCAATAGARSKVQAAWESGDALGRALA